MHLTGARDLDRDAYILACGRVMRDVMEVVRADGLAVGVDIDPQRVPFGAIRGPHKIRISYGRAKRVLSVDHETFMSPEDFPTLVLGQVKTAIEELAQTKG